MGGVDHTHPDRNTTFGSIFGRGPSVAADGGEPASGRRSSSDRRSDGGKPATAPDPEEDEIMEDVDHEAPSETGANATFERGAEHAGTTESDAVADEATDE
ncbi:hypothetical protein L593_00785 [Salinarchaeum sp. Harcht-Bsk1]|nr:hypothetical protein L593_00785 [Salinarchaeum sp. Harcht-Bsk1]